MERKDLENLVQFNVLYDLKSFYSIIPSDITNNARNLEQRWQRMKKIELPRYYETELVKRKNTPGIRKDLLIKDFKFPANNFDEFLNLVDIGKLPLTATSSLFRLLNGEYHNRDIPFIPYLRTIKDIDYSKETIEKLSKLYHYDIETYHLLRKNYSKIPYEFHIYELTQKEEWKYSPHIRPLHNLQINNIINFSYNFGKKRHTLHSLKL